MACDGNQGEAITHVISIAMFAIGLTLTKRDLLGVVSVPRASNLSSLAHTFFNLLFMSLHE